MSDDHPLGAILAAIFGFLVPGECSGCGVAGRDVCADCLVALRPEPVRRALPDGTPVFSALDYDGAVRRLLLAFKEEGRTGLAAALAPALAASVEVAMLAGCGTTASSGEAIVCRIPASRDSWRRRGFDPVGLLVRSAGLNGGDVLHSSRNRVQQKGLGVEARARNLAGAFAVRYPVRGRHVLLVDDVVTTGSTLAEAARVLRADGADVIGAATLAATPRRSGRPAGVRSESPGTSS